MSTTNPSLQWVWDDNRKEYFYYSKINDCYIYEKGWALNRAGQIIPLPDPRVPRTTPDTSSAVIQHHASSSVESASASASASAYTTDEATTALTGLSLEDNQSPDPSSQPYTSDKADPASPSPSPLEAAGSGATLFNYQTYNQQLYGQARQPPQPSQVWPGHEGTQAQNLYQVQQPYQGQQVHQAQQTYQSTQTYKGQQGYWDSKTYLAQQNLQRQTPQYGQQQYGQTASPYAAQGLHSTDANITTATQSQTGAVQPQPKVLRGGTPGTAEPLHPDFVVQHDQERFFQPGRVFKLYWPEPVGESRVSGMTTVTGGTPNGVVVGAYGQKFYAKIRWFVVIRRIGEGFSSCLCIQTYGGKGVSKRKTIKGHHSIIHTSRDAPDPAPKEAPNRRIQEAPMLSPIRVKPVKRIDKLDKMSRLNYAKVYNVEHNVKVYDFGVVHEGYMGILGHQFNTVWGLQVPASSINNNDEDDDDDEDEDDDEEEDSSDDEVDNDDARQAHIEIREPEPRERRESSSKGKERSLSRGKDERKKKVGFSLFGSSKEPRKRRGSGK